MQCVALKMGIVFSDAIEISEKVNLNDILRVNTEF